MGRVEKRSFDQLESSVDEYIYSESDHRNLTQLAVERPQFHSRKVNLNLDIDTKMASLKVSPSVVSLVSFSGPIINVSGDVIAIAYFEFSETSPFLPIHITCKWWDHYKRNKELRHPSYGFEAINLYLATLPMLEKVLTSFPSISNGVLVKEVVSGSNADSAGLREEDVITKCDGRPVRGFLEFWNFIWEKTGDVVELEVARVNDCTIQTFDMDVTEATPNQLNNWPRHNLR